MHIPDGYLSPETCAGLYVTAAPFWYVGLRRVKQQVTTRFLPLISVFAAFSFLIMMFNLPLPGGTTGHAVGVGVAAIVLGPWAAMLAISTALVIQALFFGDGGVTAIGANCFNMAIAGSLAAYGVYRMMAHRSGMGSRRRVVAAAVAGYAAINISAFLAAVEFGIQPWLFHDAAGAPLYCPYPLSISIPAMMIGHLTFAGLAELLITGAVVAYLQKADPGLLRQTAPDAPDRDSAAPEVQAGAGLPTLRRLWLALGILLVLTPLGILAVGSAWGEWSTHDFSNATMRHQIAAASGHQLPPAQAPRGLQRLSSVWTAPLSRYAPAFIRSEKFGYLVSAMVGTGLILLACLLLNRLLLLRLATGHGRLRRSFIEKTVRTLVKMMEQSLFAEELARSRGLLQQLDARVKAAGAAGLLLAAAAVHRIEVLAGLFAIAIVAATLSHVSLKILAVQVWLPVLAFSGFLSLPAMFLIHGTMLYQVPILGWTITQQGLMSSCFLLLRVETAATFTALLVMTTEWARVLRALRFFHVPITAVVILEMTYRYIYLLLQTASDMFESRQSRLIGTLDGGERRRLAGATVGVLLSKSFQLSTEVHSAMLARGFHGEVYLFNDLNTDARDWVHLGIFGTLALAAVLLGR